MVFVILYLPPSSVYPTLYLLDSGGWGTWGSWSSCSATCRDGAPGAQKRTRSCDNPGAGACSGEDTQTRDCEAQQRCSADEGWGSWSSYSPCSKTCGGGEKERTRQCGNPPWPALAVDDPRCSGPSSETSDCNTYPCPVDGGWGSWSPYSKCSETCGGGNKERTRQCNNPTPLHGGAVCSGESNQIESCNPQACPVDGGWGSWSSYSTCSRTCGGGTKSKSRNCNNPKPAHGGARCRGSSSQSKSCNTQECGPRCRLKHNGAEMESIKITSTNETTISVWGSSSCLLRILAVGAGGSEYISLH